MARISPLMLAPPAIFAAFVALAAVGMFREDPESLPSARAGQPAPPLVLTEMPGRPLFDDATLRDGQVKLVNYWASWCAPCRIEHPALTRLAADGVQIYGINYKDAPAKALAFLSELGDPFIALGADAEGRTALDWGVYGVPETYVIDGDGTILLRHAGPLTERIIKTVIEPALAQAE
ncbi:MAG: DsbE family thiol:disulfide interchange protein [Sedimentitalea sp.]|nr:DsbE family thiol:disulfide interchange protein [Sedimentitalea sp.]